MSEHDDNPNRPNESVKTPDASADQPADQPADPPPAATFDAPAPVAKDRWRDRSFRMRSIAAVAVTGLILGAAGGAVTTALVSDDDRGDRGEHRIGQQMQPGMPMVPGGGRQRFGMPDDGDEDGEMPELPEMPVPPGSNDGSEEESDGTEEQSSLSQS